MLRDPMNILGSSLFEVKKKKLGMAIEFMKKQQLNWFGHIREKGRSRIRRPEKNDRSNLY